MTTATQDRTRSGGASVLWGAALAAGLAGLVLALVGALASGSAAGSGALVGAVLVVAVFGLGSGVVSMVAGVMPTASLMVAMLTYTLQVVLMGLVFVGLSGSGLLDSTLSREWLAGAVIAGTAVWLVSQVLLTVRRRIPVFDLPSTDSSAESAQGGAE